MRKLQHILCNNEIFAFMPSEIIEPQSRYHKEDIKYTQKTKKLNEIINIINIWYILSSEILSWIETRVSDNADKRYSAKIIRALYLLSLLARSQGCPFYPRRFSPLRFIWCSRQTTFNWYWYNLSFWNKVIEDYLEKVFRK